MTQEAIHQSPVSPDGESPIDIELAGKNEEFKLHLADAMRLARTSAGLTQEQLAAKMGTNQAGISKLESPFYDHDVDSIIKFFLCCGADFLVTVRQDKRLYQITDVGNSILIDLPPGAKDLSIGYGMSLKNFVLKALSEFSDNDDNVRAIHVQTCLNHPEIVKGKLFVSPQWKSEIEAIEYSSKEQFEQKICTVTFTDGTSAIVPDENTIFVQDKEPITTD